MSLMFAASAVLLFAQQAAVSEPVARAEYLATWDALYKEYDLDGDGRVTAQEISQKMTAEQQQAALEANREIFRRIDRDGNGVLSPDEFALLVAQVPPVDPSGFLREFDANGDGTVTLVEHRTVMLSRFDAIDSDKDGVVTPAEMAASTK
ncbi:hypothetical protein GRI89_07470 [Altererythrobacter salegens]|uniref:EF-hand domain-containing protein n=1 Tax=Croceibacterium salegens TaxID=1737568 RepID=A0A6I4SV47_9SPHN|nr:EF-hand domain-containing protein [Croceibacterium salegens]MXO59378.1 hypothetical protein [Croceibacterium salegens]